jgi:hypothetical protein
MAERLFTLKEALDTLPSAAAVLLDVQRWKHELEDRSLELERLLDSASGNGHLERDVAEAKALVQQAAGELERSFRELDGLGVELKGIDQGLLDFPSLRQGRVVYLCWRQGEETIAYWHEVEAGFAGRQLL